MLTRSKIQQARRSMSSADISHAIEPISPQPSRHVTDKSISVSSAATVKARKAAAEALAKRRQLEHAKKLVELQQEVEEYELQAELAAIDAEGSRTGRRSGHNGSDWSHQTKRTEAWVHSVGNHFHSQIALNGTHLSEPMLGPNADIDQSKLVTPVQVTISSEDVARIPPPPPLDINLCGRPETKPDQVTTQSEAVARTPPPSPIDINRCGHRLVSDKIVQAVADTAAAARALATAQHRTKKGFDLIPFSGETTQWLQFRRVFDSTKAAFSPLENVIRLQQALRGPAREVVAALLISSDEPEEILFVLEQNFARPEMIVCKEVTSLRNLPRLGNDLRELGTFATKVRNSLSTIRMLNQVEYLYSSEIFHTILGKLNPTTKMRWTDFAHENLSQGQPKLELLSAFLMREFDRHVKFGLLPEHSSFMQPSLPYNRQHKKEYVHTVTQPKEYINKFVNKKSGFKNPDTVNNNVECIYCKMSHHIKACSTFKALTVDERWLWQRQAKVCFRCLRSFPHKWKSCKVNPCGVNDCSLHHHPLLHGAPLPTEITVNNISDNTQCESTLSSTDTGLGSADKVMVAKATFTSPQKSLSHSCPSSAALLKIIPVTLYGPLGSYDTYALLDDGSTATLIDDSVAARIGAAGPRQQITVNGVGGLTKNVDVSYVDFKIKGKHTHDVFDIKRARAMPSLSLHTQTVNKESINKEHLLDLSDVLTYNSATPMVLIGVDNWHLSTTRALRKGSRNEPVACLSLLGWALYGLSSNKTKCVQFINHMTCIDQELGNINEHLDFLIKEHYKLDSIGICKYESVHSRQDKRAIEILEATISRLPSGRFQVGLPWRDNVNCVPDSYPQALSRLLSLERRMRREPEFAIAYKTFIDNMKNKGYTEECSMDTYYCRNYPQNSNNVRLYLPHFGILHPQKRKLRVVHDAAALNNGVSLNSLLLSGPDLLQNLLHILFRFREGRVAVTADIKEMFPQVRIRVEDRDALRFLWRDGDQTQPIREYRMPSVIFGASSSPFTALFIKNKNAKEHEHMFPEAAKAIVEDHYMDDYLGSHDTAEVAAQIAKDIISIHSSACFEMRGWVSNDVNALKLIPAELRAEKPSEISLGNTTTTIRALGIAWDPCSDTLGFRTGLGEGFPTKLTKRKAVSHLMRVYDPLGLLGPIVIKGRILFQLCWRTNIDWDTELSPAETLKWMEWFQELSAASSIKIPRWYATASDAEPLHRELHIFADASESAYACVAYWRLVYADKPVNIALIASKARVAPLKPVSIPRLELMAALIASRLAATIKESHIKKPSKTIFWTDSTTVLGWLRSDARTFKPFVAHRIGEISENSNVKDWRWVPTSMNVADDATRLRPIRLEQCSRWFTGPSFLLLSAENWPKEPVNELPPVQYQTELKHIPKEMVGVLSERINLPTTVTADCSRFSKWLRLLRATARVHQAVFKFRQLIHNSSISERTRRPPHTSATATLVPLTSEFMNSAENHILLKTQLESFPEDFSNILNSKPLPKHSRLIKLSPVLGQDKLLYLAGRIRAVEDVSQRVRTPIILDGGHPVIQLLIQHYHVKMGHGNHETVVNELRQQYWLLRLRSSVRKVAHRCLECRIRKALPQTPPVGDLPAERMAHHKRCFSFTGLDYFGPLNVSIGRRQEKRYVALFTCLTSRAVHLELVHSLSADSAIASIRRFIARRGMPNVIYSDNGTAFVGANRILKEFYHNNVEDFACNNGITWKFIPPAAPNFGGCWERLVRSVKVALYATLKDRVPKEETLLTLLCEAESIINSRPLSHVSVHPEDTEALTPFHFLIGSSSTSILPQICDDHVMLGRTEWKKALYLAESFWARWVKEVLPTMQPRQRPHQMQENQIAIGDLVFIADHKLPRGVWPRGRVVATYPGRDNIVRVVDVCTMAGTLRRPSSKLVRIPM